MVWLPSLIAAIDVAAAAGEEAQLRMPGRAFAGPLLLEHFRLAFGVKTP